MNNIFFASVHRSDRELLGPNNQYLPKIISVFAEVFFYLSSICIFVLLYNHFCCQPITFSFWIYFRPKITNIQLSFCKL